MTDKNRKGVSDGNLDHLIDAALAKYASGEPRVGLEERILANLDAEHERVPAHAWWKWALATVTAIVMAAAAVAFHSNRRSQPVIVQKIPAAIQGAQDPNRRAANRETRPILSRPRRPPHAHSKSASASEKPRAPKLDQFPSPQPLTDEEKMLLGYIEQNPVHAGLLAEARMDALRSEAEERRRLETKVQEIRSNY